MTALSHVVLLLLGTFTAGAKQKADTYLAAYVDSHGHNSLAPGVVYGSPAPVPNAEYGKPDCKHELPTKEYSPPITQHGTPSSQYGTPSSQYGTPSSQYGTPSSQYGTPSSQYGTPSSQYGTASSQYGTPSSQYGTPTSQYGTPSSQYGTPSSQYGTPSSQYGTPSSQYDTSSSSQYGAPYSYGDPYSAPEPQSPLAPLGDKLGLVFKVLLKVLIFKLIVKFIAVICVLLFLPKLSLAKEQLRMFNDNNLIEENQLGLTQLVMDAIAGVPVSCRREDGLGCRLRKAIVEIDSKNSIPRLVRRYMSEDTRIAKKHNVSQIYRSTEAETNETAKHNASQVQSNTTEPETKKNRRR